MKSLDSWFHKPLGRAVAEGIGKQFELLGISLWGECLQIGTKKPILPQKMTVLMPESGTGGNVVGSLHALPFSNESFSMVFLPFTLENLSHISALLNEVDRVLTADGYLFISGMNPWSLWGFSRLFSGKAIWSKDIHWRSSLRMYSTLSFRGFHVHWIKSFFYRPPVSSKNMLKKLDYLESVGNMLWPYPAALYLLVAQKRTMQFLTIEPFRKKREYIFEKA